MGGDVAGSGTGKAVFVLPITPESLPLPRRFVGDGDGDGKGDSLEDNAPFVGEADLLLLQLLLLLLFEPRLLLVLLAAPFLEARRGKGILTKQTWKPIKVK